MRSWAQWTSSWTATCFTSFWARGNIDPTKSHPIQLSSGFAPLTCYLLFAVLSSSLISWTVVLWHMGEKGEPHHWVKGWNWNENMQVRATERVHNCACFWSKMESQNINGKIRQSGCPTWKASFKVYCSHAGDASKVEMLPQLTRRLVKVLQSSNKLVVMTIRHAGSQKWWYSSDYLLFSLQWEMCSRSFEKKHLSSLCIGNLVVFVGFFFSV